MQKIAFSEQLGLHDAVLSGVKTMTRRVIKNCHLAHPRFAFDNARRCVLYDGDKKVAVSRYHIGESVAISQRYKDAWDIYQKWWEYFKDDSNWRTPDAILGDSVQETPGWKNKMFVRADLMPYRIVITDIKAERLQSISNDDIREEGIIPLVWRQYPSPDSDEYIDHDVWTLPKYEEAILDPWAESEPDEWMAEDPRTAFAVLIFKLLGRKVWYDNPWVFAYSFKAITR